MNSGLEKSNHTHITEGLIMLINSMRIIGLECHVAVKGCQVPLSVLDDELTNKQIVPSS